MERMNEMDDPKWKELVSQSEKDHIELCIYWSEIPMAVKAIHLYREQQDTIRELNYLITQQARLITSRSDVSRNALSKQLQLETELKEVKEELKNILRMITVSPVGAHDLIIEKLSAVIARLG